jgi:DNA-binding response OmpR family regulator
VLLIDLEWRDAEGLELARLAHKLRHRKRMPIILVAASELSNGQKALARKVGVTDWVTKMPDIAAVSEAILQIVER